MECWLCVWNCKSRKCNHGLIVLLNLFLIRHRYESFLDKFVRVVKEMDRYGFDLEIIRDTSTFEYDPVNPLAPATETPISL